MPGKKSKTPRATAHDKRGNQAQVDTTTNPYPVVYLATLQFRWGGLFDSKPHDHQTHLVRGTERGTPGQVLCGIDRFASGGPGWSVGGGITGPGVGHTPCGGCVEVAKNEFPGLPIAGMVEQSKPMAEAVGAQHYGHPSNALRDLAEQRDAG